MRQLRQTMDEEFLGEAWILSLALPRQVRTVSLRTPDPIKDSDAIQQDYQRSDQMNTGIML